MNEHAIKLLIEFTYSIFAVSAVWTYIQYRVNHREFLERMLQFDPMMD
jgi:hypothetical protein